jgi:fluoroacetyl-CoA thioesterase
MKNIFKIGDQKRHSMKVEEKDLAGFEGSTVHNVCSTFALAREMEWSSRSFVLDMIDEDEEGIGTKLEINHLSPALIDETLSVVATLKSIDHHEIICNIEVKVEERLVAHGLTGQKILKRSKIRNLINDIQRDGGKEE